MADEQEPDFEIPSSLGIKCYLYTDGSVMLTQYDPYVDDVPSVVVITEHQIDTVIEWLTQFRSEFEANNDPPNA